MLSIRIRLRIHKLTDCHGWNFHYMFFVYHDQAAHFQNLEQSYFSAFLFAIFVIFTAQGAWIANFKQKRHTHVTSAILIPTESFTSKSAKTAIWPYTNLQKLQWTDVYLYVGRGANGDIC